MPPRSMTSEKQNRNDVLAQAHLHHRNDVLAASDLLQRNDVRSVVPERCPGGPHLACQRESSCGPPFVGPEWLVHVYAGDDYSSALPIDRWVMGPDGRPMPLVANGQPAGPDMVND